MYVSRTRIQKKIADTYTTIIRTVSTHADKIAAKIEFGKKQTNKKKTTNYDEIQSDLLMKCQEQFKQQDASN